MNPPPRFRRLLAVAVGAVAIAAPLAGCGDDDEDTTTTTAAGDDTTETTEAAATELTIDDVWVRPGTTDGNTAIYMNITAGSEAEELIGATVPADVAAKVELHETVAADGDTSTTMADGMSSTTMAGGSQDMGGDMSSTTMAGGSDMMTMKQVDKIDIPAGSTVALEPGGLHVMLFELKKDLVAGDTVEVTLTFSGAGEKTLTADVKEP